MQRAVVCAVLSLLALASAQDEGVLQTFISESGFPSTAASVSQNNCTLPCILRYTDGSKALRHVQFMRVVWTGRLKGDSHYHILSNVTYWHNKNVSFIHHRVAGCQVKSSKGNELVLDCSLSLSSCRLQTHQDYIGDYQCQVVHAITLAQYVFDSKLTQVHIGPKGEPVPFPCHFPRAMGIDAVLFTAEDNVTQRINVSWSFDPRPRTQQYCRGSRQWSIRVLSFDSLVGIRDNDTRNHNSLLQFRPTNEQRDLFYEVDEPLQIDKYYIFQLQNQRAGANSIASAIKRNYSSYIFFFGEQTKPRFIRTEERERTVSVGESVEIVCEATGFPKPVIRLLRYGRDVQLTNNRYVLRQVKQEDEGDYYCSASNEHVGPPYGRRVQTANSKFTIRVQSPDKACKNYHGAMCRSYIHDATRVFVNGSLEDELETIVSHNLGEIEFFAATHRGNKNMSDPKYAQITEQDIDRCYEFARSMTCNRAYPYCDVHSNETNAISRPICKHSCDVFREGGACAFFLSQDLLQGHHIPLAMFRELLFTSCDSRVNPGGESPECIYVSYLSPTIIGPGEPLQQALCVEGNGRGYRGNIVHTESGLGCQSWFSQSPNKHSLVYSRFTTELFGSDFACRNPGGLGERPWCYVANYGSTMRWEYCDVPKCKVCVEYTFEFCASLPGYQDNTVYIDRMEKGLVYLQDIETDMVSRYHWLAHGELSTGCEHALRVLICHGALPFCTSEGSPSALKGCSDHCTLLEEVRLHCPASIAGNLTSQWSTNRVLEPDCDIKGGSEQCMPSPHRLEVALEGTQECYNHTDNGHSYTGALAVTVDGLPCQRWSTTNTTFTSDLYPELAEAVNHCRNPGQWRQEPWCFTTSGRVGLCAVQSCDEPTSSGLTSEDSAGVVSAVVFAICAIVVICFVVVVVALLIRWSIKKRHAGIIGNSPPQLMPCNNNALRNVKFMENNQYNMIAVQQPLPPKVAEAIMSFHQIPQENIEYIRQLGQGFFGMVFKGKLKNDLEEEVFVAVKTLKEDSNDGVELFVNEAKLMFGFDHVNIVKILGVSMTKTPFYLIFEYMDRGDLAKFLRESASSEQRRHMNPCDRPRSRTESTLSDDPASLSVEQLTDICKQIASGMEYLSSKNHVHRDLACRNCLVQSVPEDVTTVPSRVIVKIGDFGLSHNLYSKDYYRVKGQAVLPIRWMSPEAIIYGKFSTAGDVWSFGVVMWEIFTFGMQPYYGTSNEEVMERVRHGRVLHKPPDCSGRMYTIMNECWQNDEHARPSFSTILAYLNECRGSTSSDEDCRSSHYSSDECLSDSAFENSDIENEISITGRVD